ncbi:MAG: hypothetical protein SXG53_18175 [Pseudomonadota bacterium]|nr:hypothetical protein [Pseudomonadota bacterium]
MKVSNNDVTKSRVSLVMMMVGIMGVAGLSQADAGVRSPGVNARQHNQQQRVRQGVRSGELTRREAGGLAREQRDVRQLERSYKSDGELTRAERIDLQQEQNQASRHIYNQKHDAQERPVAVPAPAVRDPGVNQRQGNQTARIVDGVKSGELTHTEAQDLRAGRRDIRQTEQAYKADGVLTRDERVDLHQDLDQQSRDIHAAKHNEQTRGQ